MYLDVRGGKDVVYDGRKGWGSRLVERSAATAAFWKEERRGGNRERDDSSEERDVRQPLGRESGLERETCGRPIP